MIKKTEIFLRTTEKLYKEINSRKEKEEKSGDPNPTDYDIKIEKEYFQKDEWEFLRNQVNNFRFPITFQGNEIRWYQVYKIDENYIYSNELNVQFIRNKFQE